MQEAQGRCCDEHPENGGAEVDGGEPGGGETEHHCAAVGMPCSHQGLRGSPGSSPTPWPLPMLCPALVHTAAPKQLVELSKLLPSSQHWLEVLPV